jgi:rhodanese-related sulfurtransferase
MLRLFFVTLMIFLLLPLPGIAAVSNLTPGEAREMLEKNPRVFLLDVRTPGEYRESRLEGARLIPISEIPRRLDEVPADRPVLVYCAVGSRSSQVAGFLDRQGYAEVYNLFGGIWAWRLHGLPVAAGGP